MKINHLACSLSIALACLLIPSTTAHAEGWWPGGGDQADATTPVGQETAADDDSAMVDSSMFKLSWPKVEMPKFSWKPGMGDGATSALPTAEGNPVSRALDKVAASSKSASDKVRGAWGSAMSKLPKFGGDTNTQTAKSDQPGFWKRLLTPLPPEPQGSETMSEFIAQERVGTTR